ncbi:hypothetical protein [Nonomuraea basaltis]|uniref:hypothetical protein n=1 Tax=Nonomuraea basaltis TaxID=2495887 RepID=UPI00110C3EE4|nr:hypothetical protein [Nonomuraea basaltis]TMR93149.1 hypothetical protein EJK15_40865 [Nonomuraea basaltis]
MVPRTSRGGAGGLLGLSDLYLLLSHVLLRGKLHQDQHVQRQVLLDDVCLLGQHAVPVRLL